MAEVALVLEGAAEIPWDRVFVTVDTGSALGPGKT